MQEPAFVPNGFDRSFFSEDDVLTMLRVMAEIPRYQVNLRVYIDAGLRHDWELRVLQNPPGESETVYQWVDRIFGNEKFCIAINNAEKFNDKLTQRCASFYQEYVRENSIPGPGIDMGVFMGNYGYTPFGVHHDGTGVTILHCHLGPNPKDLYMWDNDWYKEHTGSLDSNFDPESLLPYGEKFTLTPGSIFFMPEKYHVGYNKDFSIDLTFGVSDISTSDLFEKALVQSTKYLVKPKVFTHRTIPVDDVLADNFIADEFDGVDLETYVAEAVDDFKLSIRSNGGFECPPVYDTIDIDDKELIFRKVCLNKPFRLLLKNKDEKYLIVFVRRNRIMVRFSQAICDLVAKINEGDPIDVGALLSTCKGRLSEAAVLTLIRTFAVHRGLSVL